MTVFHFGLPKPYIAGSGYLENTNTASVWTTSTSWIDVGLYLYINRKGQVNVRWQVSADTGNMNSRLYVNGSPFGSSYYHGSSSWVWEGMQTVPVVPGDRLEVWIINNDGSYKRARNLTVYCANPLIASAPTGL